MSKFYVMRHGETDMNIVRCMQGHINTKLNDTGRGQAVQAKEKMEKWGIYPTVVYCSPLDRAKETAELATGWGEEKLQLDERLMEMCFGGYEGVRTADLPEEYKDIFFNDPKSFVPKNGEESYTKLRKRTAGVLKDIYKKHRDAKDTVLIVTHGAVIHDMLIFLNKLDLDLFWKEIHTANCEIFPITELLEQADFNSLNF